MAFDGGLLWLSAFVRRWLTLHLYARKITYYDGTPYLTEPLTLSDKAAIFVAHLFVLAGLASIIVVSFLGLARAILG